MVNLIAYTQDNDTPVYLDLNGDETISLNYSASEIQDITARNSAFSQTFKIPFTTNNNTFFEYAFEVNIDANTFNVRKRAKGKIVIDTIPQIEGYIQLKNIYQNAQLYEIVIFGDLANFTTDIKDLKLRDAFFNSSGVPTTTYNHYLLRGNVVNSWSGTLQNTAGDTLSDIVYPIIDFGLNLDSDDNNTPLYGGNGEGIESSGALSSVNIKNLKPSIKIKTLIDKIFENAGYRYTSTFFDSSYFGKLFMLLGTDYESVQIKQIGGLKAKQTADKVINVIQASPTAGGVPFSNTYTFEANDDSSTGFFDVDNVYNTSTFNYTPQALGTYKFRMSIKAKYDFISSTLVGSLDDTTINFGYMVRQNSTTPNDGVLLTDGLFSSQSVYFDDGVYKILTKDFTFNIDNTLNDIQFYLNIAWPWSAGLTANLTLEGGNDTYIELIEVPYDLPTSPVSIPDNMPDVLQADFFKAIVQRFNLIIEPQTDDEKHFYIEPFNDWFDAGSTIDWSDKIDYGKEQTLKYTNEFQKKEIKFEDAEDNDYLAKQYFDTFGEVFGTFYKTYDNDFTSGTLELNKLFSPYCVAGLRDISGNNIVQDDLLFARLFKVNNEGFVEPTTTKPKIFFYSGTPTNINGSYYIRGATATSDDIEYSQERTNYPFCSSFDSSPITSTTKDLNYQSTIPYDFYSSVYGGQFTNNNVFNEYWSRFINQIYSNEARVLTAHVYLTPLDILNLRYNHHIFIKDAYYRINKISGYVPSSNKATRVEFIKIVDKLTFNDNIQGIDCDLQPSVYGVNGIVTFANIQTGVSSDGTQTCCETYGFFWESGTSKCFWKQAINNISNQITSKHPSLQLPTGGLINQITGKLSGNSTNIYKNMAVGGGIFNTTKSTTITNVNEKLEGYEYNLYLMCVNNDGTTQNARINGVNQTNTSNSLTGDLVIDNNSFYSVYAEVLSVAKKTTTSTTAGSTSYKIYEGLIKNINGTASIVHFTNTNSYDDSDIGRRITTLTTPDLTTATTDTLPTAQFKVQGASDTYTDFFIKAKLIKLPLNNKMLDEFACYEDGQKIAFENEVELIYD